MTNEIARALKLKEQAQEIERKMGLRKFGDCPVCDDRIAPNGKCVYCEWNNTLTPKQTCEMYNIYWKKGNIGKGYERPAKKPEDFMESSNK